MSKRKPIVTELALADALDQLVNLIEELRADADLRVEIATDETSLVKLADYEIIPRHHDARWHRGPGQSR